MFVYNLVQKYTWKQISETMERLYPTQNVDDRWYSQLLTYLKSKPFIKNDNMWILIYKKEWENWFSVSWINTNGEYFGLSFTPKVEWLGMEIHFSNKFDLSEEEIFCHVILEMTYHGFTDEETKESKTSHGQDLINYHDLRILEELNN